MKRLAILMVGIGVLMLVALPALAQTGDPAEPMAWEALGTVAGATIAAGVIVQAAGLVASLSARVKRVLALASGVVIVVTVTVTTSDPTVPIVGLAAFNGLIAGMAAMKAQESFSHGIDHQVSG